MAAGTAASVVGGQASRADQQAAINRDTIARNAVLKGTLDKEGAFQDQNLKTIQDTTAGFDPGIQAGRLADATNGRNGMIDATISGPGSTLTDASTPQIVKDSIAHKMYDAFRYSTDMAKAKAKAAAYGDVNQGNARAISDASGNVDMTNNFAKGVGAMLPAQQDFASSAAYRPSSAVGPTLTSIGTLMAGLGGSGRLAGASIPNIPGFNPIAGVAG